MKRLTLSVLIGLSFSLLGTSASAVSLTNREGKTIEVEILEVEEARLHIRMENGDELWFERNLLSDKSQALLEDLQNKDRDIYLAINHLLGIPLLKDNLLWDDTDGEVADRLNWPNESRTSTQSSYRSYPRKEYRILASRPYSAALYGDQGKAHNISIVFANKGDFKFSPEPTDSEISDMEQAIEADLKQIESLLTQQLGDPDRQQFGAGRGIKQLIQRWDWKGHAFLLASQDGEYVNLKIMTTAAADNKGRGEKLSDAALRSLTTEKLIQRDNGDVVVGDIPMVNQGPKGYCVPATFERYLRYMQIPADMYILAMAGQTQVGGGTYLNEIIDSISGYISSQSRSMKEYQEPIKIRTVQKYIDKGLPIIWTMFSSSAYNKYSNQRTIDRQQVTDWESWEKRVKSEARSLELNRDILAGHACLIIGYNKETDEIAVSDSWGPTYRERWISVEQAEQVSQGSIYVIGF
ncbi:MAG TPA: hypothetical protein DCX06_03400 [Opitutae bacterium]|nr:hypothetical protein [Opitutae bacterium]